MNNERCDIEKDQCVDIIFRATAWITLPQREFAKVIASLQEQL